jgi:hypothetical protein
MLVERQNQRSIMAYSRTKYAPKGRRLKYKSWKDSAAFRKHAARGAKGSRVSADMRELLRSAAAAKKARKQNHVMTGIDVIVPFFVGSESRADVQQRYFALPVTMGLPFMTVAPFMSDVYHRAQTVKITGFTTTFNVSYLHAFQLSAVMFYCNNCFVLPVERPADGIAKWFPIGTKDTNRYRLHNLVETGFLSSHNSP